jgi:dTDP-4-amino-4,6-dideoxygalactose transaminase
MSSSSVALVRRLDLVEIARRRRSNARALATALAQRDVRLLADPRASTDVPSHLVVVVPDPRALQAALAGRGVYCPRHWPRPMLVAVPTWPDRLLSLPVDQRYDQADMSRIAETFDALPHSLYTMPNTKTV